MLSRLPVLGDKKSRAVAKVGDARLVVGLRLGVAQPLLPEQEHAAAAGKIRSGSSQTCQSGQHNSVPDIKQSKCKLDHVLCVSETHRITYLYRA